MYLYGASGHCKVIIDSIQSSSSKKIEGVFDDNINLKEILNIPVFKYETFDKQLIKELFISVGNNSIRKFLLLGIVNPDRHSVCFIFRKFPFSY